MEKNNFQRIKSKSNAHVGKAFEIKIKKVFLRQKRILLEENFQLELSANKIKGIHRFDLGSKKHKIIIECKSHKWTITGNSPSAKISVWNEAMYFFSLAPKVYKKHFIVLYDYSKKYKKSLAEYYIERYGYLIPPKVKIFEVKNNKAILLKTA